MGETFFHVNETERRLIKSMHKAKLTWQKIREITGRCYGTLSKIALPKKRTARAKPIGAPKKITQRVYKKLAKVAKDMQPLNHFLTDAPVVACLCT